jgi:hypothetical protein
VVPCTLLPLGSRDTVSRGRRWASPLDDVIRLLPVHVTLLPVGLYRRHGGPLPMVALSSPHFGGVCAFSDLSVIAPHCKPGGSCVGMHRHTLARDAQRNL